VDEDSFGERFYIHTKHESLSGAIVLRPWFEDNAFERIIFDCLRTS